MPQNSFQPQNVNVNKRRTFIVTTIAFVVLSTLGFAALSFSGWVTVTHSRRQMAVAVNDTFSGTSLTSGTSARRHSIQALLANDTGDGGQPNFLGIVTGPEHGALSLSESGFIKYTPTGGHIGSDSYVYRICEGGGSCNATVTLNNANQAPVGGTDTFVNLAARWQWKEGVPDVVDLLDNDTDPDGDHLSFSMLVSGPVMNTVNNTILFRQDMCSDMPGSYCTDNYSYIYKVCDSYGACTDVTVNLIAPNRAPIAGDDYYIVNNSLVMPIQQSLLSNDKDPDNQENGGTSDSLGVYGVAPQTTFGGQTARGGTYGKNIENQFFYNPPANFIGWDHFTYRVCDGYGGPINTPPNGACDTAQVNLYVVRNDRTNAGESCPAVGKPVNPANGNMYLRQTDYSLPGIGHSINLTRTYNSMIQDTGLFGLGWTSDYDVGLFAPDNYTLAVSMPDGREIVLGRTDTNQPFNPISTNFYGQAVKNADSTYTLTMKDGTVEHFSSAGKLLWMKDRNNNQTTLTYTTDGRIEKVTDPFGKVLNFTTNPTNGLVTQISDSIDVVADYEYWTGTTRLKTVTYKDGSKFKFDYTVINNKVLLTEVKDALDKIVEKHEYDSQTRATTSEVHGGLEKYTLSYVIASEPYTQVTDLRGSVTKYYFTDVNGRKLAYKTEGLCSCGGSSSQVTQWEHDTRGNITKKTRVVNPSVPSLNLITTYTYDSDGNMLTKTDIYGTETYTYNSFGQVLTYKDRLDNTTTIEYNASGNLTKIISPSPFLYETKFEYHTNGRGLLTKIISPRNTTSNPIETEINWDTTNGVVNWIEDARDNRTSFTFDARRRIKTVTNAKNEVTSYNYDNLENPNVRELVITLPDSKTIKYKYDSRRLIDTITDLRGKVWDYNFDDQYRLVSMTDPLSHTTVYGYDSMSNLTSLTNAKGEVTEYSYDEFNRPTQIKYPPANAGDARLTEKFEEYDGIGRLKKYRDTADRLTTYSYDDVARKYSVTNPANETTEIEYDKRFQTIKVKDAKLQVYDFVYDALGRLTSQTRGGQTMTYQYDEAGNRKQRTDYNGLVTKYTYDKADNLEKIAAINSVDNVTEFDVATYGYDQLNRLLTATNYAGTVTLAYDNRGRVQSETDVFGKVLSYGYTENSTTNRKTITYEGSLYSTYDFDDANRLTQLTDNTSGVYSFAYDNVNRMISRTLPNGVVTTTDYDGLGRMKFWKNVNASSAVLNEYQYGYNTANQITSITEPSRTRNFGYDNSDRLTSTTSTQSGQNENYAYDSVGNRTSSHLSASYGYQQGSFNRLTSTQQTSYSFDSNGNMTSKSEGNDKWYYFYDRENRLVNATKFGGLMPRAGQSVGYQYDALGRRVVRQDKKTGRTEFTHDGMDVIQDRFNKSDGTNSTTNYINGLGIDDKLKVTSGTTSKYFLTDHLGSTVGLSDSNGSVTESASYDSFGNKTGSLSTRYQYTGREQDEATGLMYYRARFYDPQVGRFTSEDPIGFAGGDVNLYGYVGNDPLRFSDPLGLQFRSELMPDHREIMKKRMREIPASKEPTIFGHLFGDGGVFTKQTFSEFISATERSKRNCKSTWTQRFLNNFYTTNAALPGIFAPSIFPGVGVSAITSGATANAYGSMTFLQWAATGFRGATMGAATYTALETGVIVAATSALNFVYVTAAYETGVAIGSAINATFGFDDYCPCSG